MSLTERLVAAANGDVPWRKALLLEAAIAIALSGCTAPTQAERIQRCESTSYDWAFSDCINSVVGAFSSASIEVMHECQRQARSAAAQCASAIEARSDATPKSGAARKGKSATRKGDAHA